MNTLNQIALLLFWLSFLSHAYAQNPKGQVREPIVVIDPGHGGKDAGAISIHGIKEKDIVMDIASKMVELNHKLYKKSLKVYLTRYTDTLISLSDRIQLSKKLKADVFISLHCNQATNKSAVGTEVYVYPKNEVHDEASVYLGVVIQKGLTDLLKIKSRGAKYDNFQVLRDNNSNAAILLELGFLSQTDEAISLSQQYSQNAIALVILQSIIKFLGL
ncbi:N-acetylmuramoyl-L-alanine amidase [Jejuia pallidilutea]|uniref:N-acetylmuramoyl-L-alanine amidase n=1 Tax=Jejuia pallidilutea TaxID=504487 RepID=A0A362XB67_9FLAO|nr:N-acetylmuramoyl-L-alanine amidase [Jejuia pallidilutea]PQV51461.1 N-acetylmuramoyl-L-alanine amidase [Jejuia pallidilutea]